jgi:alcohol dehydrogenase class IV
MQFEFATASQIIFGSGKVQEAISTAAGLGNRILVVTGSSPARIHSLLDELQEQKLQITPLSIQGEPTIPQILNGVQIARNAGCDLIIGCGGGSVLDTAKAIAALLTNPGDPLDYLEVVGQGKPLSRPCAPCICIPTTAGTGCEVTRNSVLIAPEHRVKVSLRSPRMLPLLAVVDPELTHSMPPSITAATGLDALTQLIEPFVSIHANPLTDALCREGILRVARWLRKAYQDGSHAEARENMSLAGLLGGLALTNAGLGAVHGLAAPLGGFRQIPHGVVCARLLPHTVSVNVKTLRLRYLTSPALSRYEEISRLLTGKDSSHIEDGIEWLRQICSDLSIPQLCSYGLVEKDLPAIAEKAKKSSSMRGNPLPLEIDELMEILHAAL